jgi:hypothetical protein
MSSEDLHHPDSAAVRNARHPEGSDTRRDPASREERPGAAAGALSRRILVVANERVTSEALRDLLDIRVIGVAEVVVVAPALVGRLGYWTGDDRRSRLAAEQRLEFCLESLRESGAEARGNVGDSDPLQAIEDALYWFDAHEIIVAAHPEGRSNWLARDIVGRAHRRFSRPTSHLAVELEPMLSAA